VKRRGKWTCRPERVLLGVGVSGGVEVGVVEPAGLDVLVEDVRVGVSFPSPEDEKKINFPKRCVF
jgi:hypothetical protein